MHTVTEAWGTHKRGTLGHSWTTFLGRCREGMTTTSSLMPAMLIRLPKGLWLRSAAPPAGSVSVSCPVVGIITSSGIIFISAPKSFLAEKLLALRRAQALALLTSLGGLHIAVPRRPRRVKGPHRCYAAACSQPQPQVYAWKGKPSQRYSSCTCMLLMRAVGRMQCGPYLLSPPVWLHRRMNWSRTSGKRCRRRCTPVSASECRLAELRMEAAASCRAYTVLLLTAASCHSAYRCVTMLKPLCVHDLLGT